MNPHEALRIYQKHLQALVDAHRNRRKTRSQRAMLKASREHAPQALASPDPRVLVWSDLHLGHENILDYANRDFDNVDEMNEALWQAWEHEATPEDHLLVVGDTAMRSALTQPTWDRIQALPGTKRTLVIGNHDLTGAGELRTRGFDETCPVLVAPGDPGIIFTHYPLGEVPEGHVNVHGHQHDAPVTRTPHINVSVEQLDYRPVRLDAIRTLARRIVTGDFPEGETTLERLQWMELEGQC